MAKSDIRKALGRAQRVYRGRTVTWPDFFLRVLPGVLVPLGFLAYGTYRLIVGYTQNNRAITEARGWFLLAALALIPYAIFTFRRFASSRKAVVRYANGLRFIRIPAGQKILLWRQIRGLRTSGTRYLLLGKHISDRYSLTIEPFHGAPIEIPGHLQDLPDLAEHIKQAIYPLLLPAIEEELLQDRAVSWGPLTIDREQIRTARQSIPWTSVRGLRVDSGQLLVDIAARQMRFPTRSIPNVELLLQIVDRQIDSAPISQLPSAETDRNPQE